MNIKKAFFFGLTIIGSILLFDSTALAGCERNVKEEEIRNKYNNLVSFAPGQYNALQTIPIAVDTYFFGGAISSEWVKSELRDIGIDGAWFLVSNGFNPSTDEVIGDVMTFQCYERPFLPFDNRKVYGPNIFVPYVAIRRSSGSSGNALVNAGGLCLDVHQPDMRNNGGKVQVWQCNGEPQQQWSLRGNEFVNAGGMCLDVHAPDMRNNGGRVQVWQCNGQPQQQWSLRGNALVNAGGMCLDVHAPDMRNNGGRVQVWQCNGEPQQQWRF